MSFPPQSFYFIDGNTAIGQSTLNQIQSESGTFGIGATTSLIVDQVNATGVITASKFVGNIEGTVSGNISGTAGGLSGTPNIYVNAIDANRFHNTGVTTSQGGFDGDLTGNADSATQLQTARNIGGVSFNGTGDINLPGVNIAGNQNTSGTAANLSGTPDIVVGNVTASNISIAGTLTYDDVTNVDSLGIVTARTGLDVLAGGAQITGNSTIDGETTIYGNVDLQANLDVDGHTNLDNVSISGVTTFSNSVNFDTDLDVDGHTNLDNVSIAGVTTMSGLLDINGGARANSFKVENLTPDRIVLPASDGQLEGDANLTFNGTSLFVGVNLDVDGTAELDLLNVAETATFSSNIDANGDLDVDGHTNLDNVSISGFTTITQDLDVDGHTNLDNVSISGVVTATTFIGDGDFVELDVDGHTNLDNVSISGVVTATTFVGDGDFVELDVDGHTNLDNVSIAGVTTFTGNIDADGNLDVDGNATLDVLFVSESATFNANIDANGNLDVEGTTDLDVLNVSETATFSSDVDIDGHTELDNVNASGVVTATTFEGNQIIGTPAGGFKSGAFTISSTDHTKDSINELNFILGKLVPVAPDTFNGLSLSLTGTDGTAYLCQGFTPTNNTGGSAPLAGSQYVRNTDSTITTNYINDVGPGDSGTVTGFVNAVSVGTTTLDTGVNNATSSAVQIADNKDASQSTRNTGITANFYQVYDVRLINASSPDGYNKAYLTHGSATTGEAFWYEDPSTVSAPIISFSAVTSPSNPTLSYSSGVPHYTESTNNNLTYVATVENASGDMYSYSNYKLLNSDGQTTGFTNAGHIFYNNFAGGTHPPARNFGVGTGVTTLITNTPNNIHNTITSGHFSSYDAVTPYGSHNNQAVSFSTNVNLMGTTSTTSQIDEDNILISSLGTGSGNATRVSAGAGGDNPTSSYTSWTASSSVSLYEAVVRGGTLRHDQTNYSTGYLPVGPDYSSGRSGAQYFQVEMIRSNVSEFNISYTGSAAGCFVCMPDNSTWTTSLSGTNGWADMFQAYRGAGLPTSSEPGCSSGGVMGSSGGTFTCTFGTSSSSHDSNNRILIRWKLTSGQSITALSFSAT